MLWYSDNAIIEVLFFLLLFILSFLQRIGVIFLVALSLLKVGVLVYVSVGVCLGEGMIVLCDIIINMYILFTFIYYYAILRP